MHPDLIKVQECIYRSLEWMIEDIKPGTESQEYGACTFIMNGKYIVFRVAKITPTKVGQFVTLWKRYGKGPTMPYDEQDPFDFIVVNARSKDHFGQFVFPKNVLVNQGIVSKNGQGGKRGIRVYPAWDKAENPQAKRTQTWQSKYFFEIKHNQIIDKKIIQSLFTGPKNDSNC